MTISSASLLTRAQEARFLSALAVTCNVTQSALAAGRCHQTAYKTRLAKPAFRAKWQAALAEGYARVELRILQRALGQEEERPAEVIAAAAGTKEPSDRVLLHLLGLHRAAVTREEERLGRGRGGKDPRVALVTALRRMRVALEGDGGGVPTSSTRTDRSC